MVSLDTGGPISGYALVGYLKKLPDDPENMMLAVAALCRLCRIDVCSACNLLRVADCETCFQMIEDSEVPDEDRIQGYCNMVLRTVQMHNRRRVFAMKVR